MIKRKSFTLVELVIVLVILSILVSLALPTYMGTRQRAYRAEALQVLSEVKALAWAYNIENGGTDTLAVWSGIDSISAQNEKWAAMGYISAPRTDNWNFTINNRETSLAGCTGTTGGCFNVTAEPSSTTTQELPNVRLLINATGNVMID